MSISLPIAFWDAVAFGQASDVWLSRCLGVRPVTILKMRRRRKIPVYRGKRSFRVTTDHPRSLPPWHLVDWSMSNEEIAIKLFKGRVALSKVAFIRKHRTDLARPFLPTLELIEEVLHERRIP